MQVIILTCAWGWSYSRIRWWLLFCLPIVWFPLSAQQQEMAFFFSHEAPQARALNPAVPAEKEIQIGLPGMAANVAHSGFTYRHLIRRNRSTNEIYLDGERALQAMAPQNHIIANMTIEFLRLQYGNQRTQWEFAASERLSVYGRYPKALAELIWYGNMPFSGETLEVGPDLQAMRFRQYSIGVNRQIRENLRVGVQASYLRGIAAVTTATSSLEVYTDPDLEYLQVTPDYQFNRSNAGDLGKLLKGYPGSALNAGWSLNLGAVYQPHTNWQVAVSILDIGFIGWTGRTSNLSYQNSFTFSGIDLNDFVSGSVDAGTYTDSLNQLLEPDTTTGSFRTWLVPKTYIGVSHRYSDRHEFQAVLYGEFPGRLNPAFSIGYRYHIKKIWKDLKGIVGIHYAYKNRSWRNFGLSTVLTWRRYQFFLAGDNLLSLFLPKTRIPIGKQGVPVPRHMKNMNIRIGFGIRF